MFRNTVMKQPRLVAYYRVSTEKQGRSGLGLEAQREAVARHIESVGGTVVEHFEEVESGKRNDRPQLAAALAACRAHKATLIIAKLDRLARNVAFIANLMESGVDFVACDMPQANRFTVHILAAVAEHERAMISARTKAALAAAKARGVQLGNPNLRPGNRAASRHAAAAKAKQAKARANDVLPYIAEAKSAGAGTLRKIAGALNARGIPTPRGGQWHAAQVKRVIERAGAV